MTGHARAFRIKINARSWSVVAGRSLLVDRRPATTRMGRVPILSRRADSWSVRRSVFSRSHEEKVSKEEKDRGTSHLGVSVGVAASPLLPPCIRFRYRSYVRPST